MGGCGSAGDFEFVEDGPQIGVHGARAEHELVGDLGVAETFGNQPEDVDFA